MERRLFEGFLNKNISSILHVTLWHCKDTFLSSFFYYLTFCCCCYSFFWFLVCFVDTQIRGCIHVGMLSCKVQLFCWGLSIRLDLYRATHTFGVTAQCIYVSLVLGMIVLVTFARPGLTETAGAVVLLSPCSLDSPPWLTNCLCAFTVWKLLQNLAALAAHFPSLLFPTFPPH